ncbi:MAG: hypothetical protein JXQ83_10560 [Candidatus Glassbacteria bacterium]|nr:hypothetical protein [Candidatus Glassbacteria bacterium]
MKAAILCREFCRTALQTLRYFGERGTPLSLVVIETGQRKKFSGTELDFIKAHQEFERILGRGPSIFRRTLARVPNGLRNEFSSLYKKLSGKSDQPVADCAAENSIPVVRVERHSSEEARRLLEEHGIETGLLTRSSWLIKEPLLSMCNFRLVNVHPAKLPEHRSLDSLPWSIISGGPIGLTVHFIDKGVDTGPVLLFREVKPLAGDDLIRLRERIDSLIPEAFYDAVTGLQAGLLEPVEQSPEAGVHHRPMTVEELVEADRALRKMTENG